MSSESRVVSPGLAGTTKERTHGVDYARFDLLENVFEVEEEAELGVEAVVVSAGARCQ